MTGQDIHALIHQRVLDPLEMADTSLVAPAGTEKEKEGRVGSSFKWSGKAGFRPIPAGGRFDASHGRPRAVGGSAYSTAVDMAKCVGAFGLLIWLAWLGVWPACTCFVPPFLMSTHNRPLTRLRYLHALVDPEGPGARGVVTAPIMDEMLRPVYSRDPFLPAQALSFAVEECQTNVRKPVSVMLWGRGAALCSFIYTYTFSTSPRRAQNDPEVAYVTCGQGMGFGGYQTAICFSRQRGVGVAVLCNAGSDSYELSQARFSFFVPGWSGRADTF